MKELLIMRHGKSDWSDASLNDYDRPLKKRGRKAAASMGQKIESLNLTTDIILSSPATRARETTKIFIENSNYNNEVMWLEDIYYKDEHAVLGYLQTLPDTYQRAMVVGHNPTLENLGNILVSTGKLNIKIPTAAILYISFPVNNWEDVKPSIGLLKWLLPPKIL